MRSVRGIRRITQRPDRLCPVKVVVGFGYYEKEETMEQHWCMCEELKSVARDCKSTCSICGGKDAYGKSGARPKDMLKTIRKPVSGPVE